MNGLLLGEMTGRMMCVEEWYRWTSGRASGVAGIPLSVVVFVRLVAAWTSRIRRRKRRRIERGSPGGRLVGRGVEEREVLREVGSWWQLPCRHWCGKPCLLLRSRGGLGEVVHRAVVEGQAGAFCVKVRGRFENGVEWVEGVERYGGLTGFKQRQTS